MESRQNLTPNPTEKMQILSSSNFCATLSPHKMGWPRKVPTQRSHPSQRDCRLLGAVDKEKKKQTRRKFRASPVVNLDLIQFGRDSFRGLLVKGADLQELCFFFADSNPFGQKVDTSHFRSFVDIVI